MSPISHVASVFAPLVALTQQVHGITVHSSYKALILNHGVNTKLFFTSGAVRNWWILRTDCVAYAMVGSPNRKRLAIYAREPTLVADLYRHLVRQAKGMGYDTSRLLLTSQRQAFFPSGLLPGAPVPEYLPSSPSPVPEHVLDESD